MSAAGWVPVLEVAVSMPNSTDVAVNSATPSADRSKTRKKLLSAVVPPPPHATAFPARISCEVDCEIVAVPPSSETSAPRRPDEFVFWGRDDRPSWSGPYLP